MSILFNIFQYFTSDWPPDLPLEFSKKKSQKYATIIPALKLYNKNTWLKAWTRCNFSIFSAFFKCIMLFSCSQCILNSGKHMFFSCFPLFKTHLQTIACPLPNSMYFICMLNLLLFFFCSFFFAYSDCSIQNNVSVIHRSVAIQVEEKKKRQNRK